MTPPLLETKLSERTSAESLLLLTIGTFFGSGASQKRSFLWFTFASRIKSFYRKNDFKKNWVTNNRVKSFVLTAFRKHLTDQITKMAHCYSHDVNRFRKKALARPFFNVVITRLKADRRVGI